jgi:hypothetical protein
MIKTPGVKSKKYINKEIFFKKIQFYHGYSKKCKICNFVISTRKHCFVLVYVLAI